MIATRNNLNSIHRPQTAPAAAVRLEELIGNTPLLRLDRAAAAHGVAPGVSLLAKAEWTNPGGSVKERDGDREGERTKAKEAERQRGE